jgi:hypothetical protein
MGKSIVPTLYRRKTLPKFGNMFLYDEVEVEGGILVRLPFNHAEWRGDDGLTFVHFHALTYYELREQILEFMFLRSQGKMSRCAYCGKVGVMRFNGHCSSACSHDARVKARQQQAG